MKRTICWITAGCFIDVDIDIVPALANHFNIHWVIWGDVTQGDWERLEKVSPSDSLSIEQVRMKHKWYSPFIYFEYQKYLGKYAQEADILYVDVGGGLCFYQALYKVCQTNKTVLAIHNVKTPKGAHHEAVARHNTRYAVKKFVNIQTFSHNQHDYLNSLAAGKNVLEAPLMLKDYGDPKGERKDSTFNFLTFGHIREYKRVDLLIHAAQELTQRTDKKFKVTIAGNCKTWEKYQRLITMPELFTTDIGFIDNDDIPEYFNEADFFVLPYQDLAQSGAITVAFQYNVPVITSDIEQFKEYNIDGETGLTFASCDSHSLSLKMEEALNMTDDRLKRMKQKQKEFVAQVFSREAILSKYIAYFNRL